MAATHHPPNTNGRPLVHLAQLPPAIEEMKKQIDAHCEAQKQAWRDAVNYAAHAKQQVHIYGEECRLAITRCLDGSCGVEAGSMLATSAQIAGHVEAHRATRLAAPVVAPAVRPAGLATPIGGQEVREARLKGYEDGKCPECGKRTIVASGSIAKCDSCPWQTNCYQHAPDLTSTVYAGSTRGRAIQDHEGAQLAAARDAHHNGSEGPMLTPQEVEDVTMTRIGRIDESTAGAAPSARQDGKDASAEEGERTQFVPSSASTNEGIPPSENGMKRCRHCRQMVEFRDFKLVAHGPGPDSQEWCPGGGDDSRAQDAPVAAAQDAGGTTAPSFATDGLETQKRQQRATIRKKRGK